jgi:hypothetical protein
MQRSVLKSIHQSAPFDRDPDPQPLDGHPALPRIGNTQLARQVKLSRQWTSRIVNAWVNASEAFMDTASKALGMPIDELFRPWGCNGF